MPEPTTIHNTFVIERSYPKPPETVYAAFADAAKKRRWFAEGDHHDVEEFEMDFRIGGAERLEYKLKPGTPFPGAVIASDGVFEDIVPNRRIVTASSMTFGDRRISAALVTVEFLQADQGTDLICTHQGAFFEGSDGPKMREGGWRTLFEKLTKELCPAGS